MILWRISRHPDLSGEGGLYYSGRWHKSGRFIVYLADSLAGAMLETLVHLEITDDAIPLGYFYLRVSVSEDVIVVDLPVLHEESESNGKISRSGIEKIGKDTWQDDMELTQSIGDRWLSEGASALARVPSSIVPHTWNYLLNPAHPDASKVVITSAEKCKFDERLLVGRRSFAT